MTRRDVRQQQKRIDQTRLTRRAGARGSPGLKRAAAFGAITLAVFSLAGYFLWPTVKPIGSGSPGAVTVQVSMGGFNPSGLEVRVGEPVILRLVNKDNRFHNDGGGWHQFAVDELGLDFNVPPLKTQEFTFTSTTTGTFEYYCDVCCGGRENPYMQGTLVVTS